MLRIDLTPDAGARLRSILALRGGVRSDHWETYGGKSRILLDGDTAIVNAGAGFDSEYELNFRGRTLRERFATRDLKRYRAAFREVCGVDPLPTESPHHIVAQFYMPHLTPCSSYLEIGAGTGYLAGLVAQRFGSRVTIIDLPEILPYSFLYLSRRGVDVTSLAGGESIPDASIDLAVNTASFQEMVPEQITYYFELLRRVLKPGGVFFTCNRVEKVINGKPVRFADYPWFEDEVLIDQPSALHAITQPAAPMRMRLSRLAQG